MVLFDEMDTHSQRGCSLEVREGLQDVRVSSQDDQFAEATEDGRKRAQLVSGNIQFLQHAQSLQIAAREEEN